MCDVCSKCGRVDDGSLVEDGVPVYVDSMCEEHADGGGVRTHLLVNDWEGRWALCTHCNEELFTKILALLKKDYNFPRGAKLTISPGVSDA